MSDKKKTKSKKDPYMSRNEFKPGFYDQEKPPVSYESLKGTAASPIPNVTDTEYFVDGGEAELTKGKDYIKDNSYFSDLLGPVDVTPRVEAGTRFENATEIKDKVIGVNINSKFGNVDISKKKEDISYPGGSEKVNSTGIQYRKDFESGFGAEAGITKRDSEFGKSTDKRAIVRYKKTFVDGGEVELTKGKDYIKDLL